MAGPSGATTRLALPYPVSSDSADVPRDVKALTDVLDPIVPPFSTGTSAARPVPSPAGRLYWNTDTLTLEVADGTTWFVLGKRKLVTALPSSPYDGQEILFQTAQSGVLWGFRYNAASSSPYKWEFTGGAPLYSRSDSTLRSTTSETYVALAGAPTLTFPLNGDYDVALEATLGQTTAGFFSAFDSYSIDPPGAGVVAASDVWGIESTFNNNMQACRRSYRHSQQVAGAVLTENTRVKASGVAGVTANVAKRSLTIAPIRVN